MLKTVLIVGLVILVMLGGMLALRSSSRTGMPSEDVLKRAGERERDLKGAEKDRDD